MAIQSLRQKGFLELRHGEYEDGEYYETVTVTDNAWTWLDRKHPLLSSKERKEGDDVQLTEDDIPF